MMSKEALIGLSATLTELAANGFGVPKDKIKLVDYFLTGGSAESGVMTEDEVYGFLTGLELMVSNGFSSLKDEVSIVRYVLGKGE